MKNNFIVGIIGKISSGKTTVSKIFEKLGAKRINCDQIVHNLYKPKQAGWKMIKKYFGLSYFNKNNTVNRKKLGKLIFTNQTKLKLLNKIIHPLVETEVKKIISKEHQKMIIIEAISFSFNKLGKLTDLIINVHSPQNLIFKHNKKYSLATIKQILKQQKNIKKGDITIQNNKDKKHLEKEVKKIYNKISNNVAM